MRTTLNLDDEALADGMKVASGKAETDAELAGLLERLQTPTAKTGLEAAFNASPAALGQAAAEAARRRSSVPSLKTRKNIQNGQL